MTHNPHKQALTMPEKLCRQLEVGAFDTVFARLYPQATAEACRARCRGLLACFVARYGNRPVALLSAPGRTEIGGNHTDHQQGRVLAAAVDLDVLCVAAPNNENIIRLQSEGYPACAVALRTWEPRPEEQGKPAGILRGMADWLRIRNFPIGGFDMVTDSQVPIGSGLSSSAAFEVAVGQALRALYAPALSPVDIAMAGQHAERQFWSKPSGLMDQMASSLGGFSFLDFADPGQPDITPIAFAPTDYGLQLMVVNTGGSHANLTGDYAAIPQEMSAIAQLFGQTVLRQVPQADFESKIAELRAQCGDRAVLRAWHFYREDARVARQAQALAEGRAADFLAMVTESGASSFTCLQNIYAPAHPEQQGVSLALAMSAELLQSKGGAWRVHGGGFAGTVLAFVPVDFVQAYTSCLEAVFGSGACLPLAVRPDGGVAITEENLV